MNDAYLFFLDRTSTVMKQLTTQAALLGPRVGSISRLAGPHTGPAIPKPDRGRFVWADMGVEWGDFVGATIEEG